MFYGRIHFLFGHFIIHTLSTQNLPTLFAAAEGVHWLKKTIAAVLANQQFLNKNAISLPIKRHRCLVMFSCQEFRTWLLLSVYACGICFGASELSHYPLAMPTPFQTDILPNWGTRE